MKYAMLFLILLLFFGLFFFYQLAGERTALHEKKIAQKIFTLVENCDPSKTVCSPGMMQPPKDWPGYMAPILNGARYLSLGSVEWLQFNFLGKKKCYRLNKPENKVVLEKNFQCRELFRE